MLLWLDDTKKLIETGSLFTFEVKRSRKLSLQCWKIVITREGIQKRDPIEKKLKAYQNLKKIHAKKQARQTEERKEAHREKISEY